MRAKVKVWDPIGMGLLDLGEGNEIYFYEKDLYYINHTPYDGEEVVFLDGIVFPLESGKA